MEEYDGTFTEWVKDNFQVIHDALTELENQQDEVATTLAEVRGLVSDLLHASLKNLALVNDNDHGGFRHRKDGIFTYVNYELSNPKLHCIATAKHCIDMGHDILQIQDTLQRTVSLEQCRYGFCRLPKDAVLADPVAVCFVDSFLRPDPQVTHDGISSMDVAVVLVKDGPPHGRVAPRRMEFPNAHNHIADKSICGASVGTFVMNNPGVLKSSVFGLSENKYTGQAFIQDRSGAFDDSGALLLLKNELSNELDAFGVLAGDQAGIHSRVCTATLLPSMQSMVAAKVVDTVEAEIAKIEVLMGNFWILAHPVRGTKGVMLKYDDKEVYGVF